MISWDGLEEIFRRGRVREMLSAFVKDESGGIVIAYGAFALGLTLAIVSLAGVVGSVMGHSYSAIPDETIEAVPAMEGLSLVAGYLDGAGLGAMIRLSGGSM
jgi:Flp pilus assembly pilin Flp